MSPGALAVGKSKPIRVLVVEESPTVRELLVHVFNAAPDMAVVGTAADGDAAVQAVCDLKPDVVSMDVAMPRVSGLDATRRIMRECPVPIVIVSGIFADQVSASFHALEAGAIAFVRKPSGPGEPSHAREVADLVQTVRLMSEVKVIRRTAGGARLGAVEGTPERSTGIDIIAVGASTGGPPAILALLREIPRDHHPPILIVQHIAGGFLGGFVTWLTEATGHAVRLGVEAEPVVAGRVYIAPDGFHMGVNSYSRIALSAAPPENGLRPAVSYLFRSVSTVYGNASVAAVLLSGMGKDGAKELLDLKQGGGLTFAQDRDTALVFGMPGEAVKLEAARYVMSPGQIGAALKAQAANRRVAG